MMIFHDENLVFKFFGKNDDFSKIRKFFYFFSTLAINELSQILVTINDFFQNLGKKWWFLKFGPIKNAVFSNLDQNW